LAIPYSIFWIYSINSIFQIPQFRIHSGTSLKSPPTYSSVKFNVMTVGNIVCSLYGFLPYWSQWSRFRLTCGASVVQKLLLLLQTAGRTGQ
jgi:hypothetical protein